MSAEAHQEVVDQLKETDGDEATKTEQPKRKLQEAKATASQKDEAGKHLASKVKSLKQQVPQAMASKASVERKRNATTLNGKQTKRSCGKLQGDSRTKASKLRTVKETGQFRDTATSRYKDIKIEHQGLRLREAQRKEKDFRVELKKCRADLEIAQKAKEKLQRGKDTADHEKALRDKQVKELADGLRAKTEELSVKEKQIFSLMKEQEEAKETIVKLKDDKKDLMVKHDSALRKAETELTKTKRELKALEQDRDQKFKAQEARLVQQRNSVMKENEELTRKNCEAAQQIESLKIETEKAQRQHQALKKKYAQLQEQLNGNDRRHWCGEMDEEELIDAISHPADIIEALDHSLDSHWRAFGSHLRVSTGTMDAIERDKQDARDRMLQLVEKWLEREAGTYNLPRTWRTVFQAVKSMGKRSLAQKLAQQYGVKLSGQ